MGRSNHKSTLCTPKLILTFGELLLRIERSAHHTILKFSAIRIHLEFSSGGEVSEVDKNFANTIYECAVLRRLRDNDTRNCAMLRSLAMNLSRYILKVLIIHK